MNFDANRASPKELETFLCDVPATTQCAETALCSLNSTNGTKVSFIAKRDAADSDLVEETILPVNVQDVVTFKFYRNKRIHIIKALIPMRIALFLWFGAGTIPMSFLSVLMRQKGLSIAQFSSVFSVTFLFQMLIGTLSGIVSDKIGNAKPVLMFHMLATVATIICIVLAPAIDNRLCHQGNFTCLDAYDGTVIDLSKCSFAILQNITKHKPYDSGNLTSSHQLGLSVVLADINEENSTTCFVNVLCQELERNCTSLCASLQEQCPCTDNIKYVIIYGILILCFVTFWSCTYRFLEVAVMFVLKTNSSNYGLERTFAIAGDLSVSLLIAIVMDATAPMGEKKNYDVVYWISACLMFLAFISVYTIEVPINEPGKKLLKKTFKLMKNMDVLSFFIIIFVNGNVFAYNYSFHFLFLETLEAPRILFGLHKAAITIYGIAILLTSKWWLKTFGTEKLLVFSLVSYAIGETLYSFLYNPWLSLAIELTSVFTYHLLWMATVVHGHSIAPEGLVSTIVVLPGIIHFGLARSTGVLGFGFLTAAYGQRTTYRVLAAMCLATAILYSAFLYWRHQSSKNKRIQNVMDVKEEHQLKESALGE